MASTGGTVNIKVVEVGEPPYIHTLIKDAIKGRNWGGRKDSITFGKFPVNIYIYYEEFLKYHQYKTKYTMIEIFDFMLEVIESKISNDDLQDVVINFKALNGEIKYSKEY